mmetsp:Transcript_56474/g.103641  ORF Transcript_56474/g.103641 Transcript_56474/m.103641 type:complete len:129 (+) Transcript_56474:93-479(+)
MHGSLPDKNWRACMVSNQVKPSTLNTCWTSSQQVCHVCQIRKPSRLIIACLHYFKPLEIRSSSAVLKQCCMFEKIMEKETLPHVAPIKSKSASEEMLALPKLRQYFLAPEVRISTAPKTRVNTVGSHI